MATTKKTADQVKAAMAKVEAAKKAEAAKAETKAEEKKAPVKAAAKTTTKAAEKKAPAKTAAKVTETVYIQSCGYEVTTADITAKVVAAVGKKVKELNIYVKPEDGMVYYTADGVQGSVEL